jgi:glutathione S-transferase
VSSLSATIRLGNELIQATYSFPRFPLYFLQQIGEPALSPLIIARIHSRLNPRSEAYFRSTREASLGEKLEDVRPPGPKRERGFKGLKTQLDMLNGFLDNIGSGKPFVMGDTLSFADCVLGGWLFFLKLMIDSEEWQEVACWNGGRWARVLATMEQWEAGKGDEEVYHP